MTGVWPWPLFLWAAGGSLLLLETPGCHGMPGQVLVRVGSFEHGNMVEASLFIKGSEVRLLLVAERQHLAKEPLGRCLEPRHPSRGWQGGIRLWDQTLDQDGIDGHLARSESRFERPRQKYSPLSGQTLAGSLL